MDTVMGVAAAGNHNRNTRRCRQDRAEQMRRIRSMCKEGVSERKAAANLGVPRTTVQAWRAHEKTLDAEPELVDFFESPVGLAFLHRLVHALHLVFVELGGCGIRLLCQALQLTGLDQFVASSYESQRRVNVAVEEAIIDHTDGERKRLAAEMPEKDITVAQDETFTGGLTLVAIEPESGFILLEESSRSRDAAAWGEAMGKSTDDLKVNIVQSTSDEGKGLVAYAANLLGAHHSPDLFHVQQELSRGMISPLAAKIRAAERSYASAQEELKATELAAEKYQQNVSSRGVGRPPDWTARINAAALEVAEAEVDIKRLQDVQKQVREDIQGLSDDYHLADPIHGIRQSGEIITNKLRERIKRIKIIIENEGLSESSMKRIEKAERVLPAMGSTIDFVSDYIRRQVNKLGLTASQAFVFHSKLIPASYLKRIANRKPRKDRAPQHSKASELMVQAFALKGNTPEIPPSEQEQLKADADRLAGIFQRSSSCVEGRNGVLSFRHHGLRGISDRKRKCLTALHNYFIKRPDGKTAAERFFEHKPADLFHAILDRVGLPPRPKSPVRRNCA